MIDCKKGCEKCPINQMNVQKLPKEERLKVYSKSGLCFPEMNRLPVEHFLNKGVM